MISLAACFTQRPLSLAVPAPATRIVAEVTDEGVVAMSDAIGPGSIEVEGVIVSADADSWVLQVIRVDHRDGRSILWNREQVTFPRHALTDVQERTLDKKRSWITAGLITASALLVGGLFQLVASDENEGTEPIPTESVIRGGGRRY